MLKIKFPDKWDDLDQSKCVIKITVGDKFYIGRSANLSFVNKELRSVYKKYKYAFNGGVSEDNLFYPIVKHMVDKGIEFIEIEILYESHSGYEVLKEELRLLQENFGKRACLNKNKLPHLPQTFKTSTTQNRNRWLTHNEWLNFKKLLNKYEQ